MTTIFSSEPKTMFKASQTSKAKDSVTVGNIDIYSVLTAEELFRDERTMAWLEVLPELTGTTSLNYKLYYEPVLRNFAEFVQNLPEARQGFYSHIGGFLHHGLERTVRAMELCQSYLKSGIISEASEEQRALWNYAVFTAALLFDVGKVFTKLVVTLRQHTKKLKLWNPFEGSMLNLSSHYSYDFPVENRDDLRKKITALLAEKLMTEAGFGWLSTDRDILSEWFALFEEDYLQVSAWLCLIPRADAELLDKYFNHYEKELAEKAKSDKLAVFKDPSLALKSTEISKTPPAKTSGLFSPQGSEGGFAAKAEKLSMSTVAGEAFLQWLKKGLASEKLSVNLPNSGVHVTVKGALLLEKVFQDFAKENPVYGNWRDVKQQFEQLEITGRPGAEQQAFRYYGPDAQIKPLEGLLIANIYAIFLHNQNMPEPNRNIGLVSLVQGTLPSPRTENLNVQPPPQPTPQQR